MRFIVGIDAYRFPGAKLERSLRSNWDIADYDIYPVWEKQGSLVTPSPQHVEERAKALVAELERKAEAAYYYIGFTRGFCMEQRPRDGRIDLFSMCWDFAYFIDRSKEKSVSVCLNPRCLKERNADGKKPLTDDAETLYMFNEVLRHFCKIVVSTSA